MKKQTLTGFEQYAKTAGDTAEAEAAHLLAAVVMQTFGTSFEAVPYDLAALHSFSASTGVSKVR